MFANTLYSEPRSRDDAPETGDGSRGETGDGNRGKTGARSKGGKHQRNRVLMRVLGVALFALGVLLGTALLALASWGDLEASMFDTAIRGDASLRTLRCPVLITPADQEGGSAAISATFKNRTDKPVDYRVRTRITEGFVSLMREVNDRIPLEPGESQRLEWPVTADDAAYGRVILARVLLFGHYPQPSRHASCGVLVADLPALTGRQIVTLVLVAGMLAMAGGAGLWWAAARPLDRQGTELARAMSLLAGSVGAGLVLSFLGAWLLGLLALVVLILLSGGVIGHFATRGART